MVVCFYKKKSQIYSRISESWSSMFWICCNMRVLQVYNHDDERRDEHWI